MFNKHKSCCHHHYHHHLCYKGPSGSQSPAGSGSCSCEDTGPRAGGAPTCEFLRGSCPGDGTQPLSSGGTGRGPGRLAHQPTAARPSAQGPVGRQGLGQRPWWPALTLGPGSPVSGGHPSATAPPARNGAQGRRSRAAPRPARRKREMLAGAGEELLAPSRGRNGAQLPKSPQAATFTLTI